MHDGRCWIRLLLIALFLNGGQPWLKDQVRLFVESTLDEIIYRG